MNVNLLTIDVLSAMPAQPVRSGPARGTATAEGHEGFGLDGNQLALEAGMAAVNRRAEQSATAGAARRPEALQSDNISHGEQVSQGKPLREGFENVLRRQLKANESQSESGDVKIAEKPRKSETANKNGQTQPLILLQGNVPVLAEQKQPIIDGKPASKQTSQAVKQAVTQTTTQPSKDAQVPATAGVNHGKDIKGVVLQQAQPAVSTIQNQDQPKVVSQNEIQKQVAGQQGKLTDGGQTTAKTTAVQSRPAENAGSGKTAESTNRLKPAADAKQADLLSQPEKVQSKNQTTTLLTSATAGNADTSRQQITAGEQGGVEATHQNRLKDKLNTDRQGGSQKSSADGQTINGQAEKLNVEKIEFASAKSDATKSQSGNESANLSRGQIANVGSNQVAENTPPVISRAAATAANNAGPDNAATVREQIYQSIRASVQQGQSQITIKLNPPELGQVSVKFSEQGKELTGLLEVTNSQTRADIRNAIPEIIRSLEQSGITVKRLDVTLSDLPRQPSQQSLRDNSSQDPWEQFSQHGFHDNTGNRSSYESNVTHSYNTDTPETPVAGSASIGRSQSLPSDNLLDVLI